MSSPTRLAWAGFAAAGLTLSVAETIAAAARSIPSPALSTGSLIIRLAPGGAARAGIAAAGTADKPLLVTVIVVAWLGFGALAGRWYGRRPATAVALFIGVAALAGFAAAREPGAFPPAVFAASVAAVGVGLAAFRFLARASAPTVSTMGPADPARRRFMAMTGAVVLVAAGGAVVARKIGRGAAAATSRLRLVLPKAAKPAIPVPPGGDFELAGLSPLVTPNRSFYRIDTALGIPDVDVDTWRLKVTGRVSQPLVLSFDELAAMPQVEEWVTLCCVSNEIGGNYIGTAKWLGVPLTDVLRKAGVSPSATQIVGKSVDGFTAGFPTKVALDGRPALVAIGMNDEPLPLRHGFPARLVVAGLYGYVSATKWLTEIHATTREGFDGYWIQRGWAKLGPVKIGSRIDVVRKISTGTQYVAAGVAWAQPHGIQRVEVRLDDGAWGDAELATDLTNDTWRQWRYTFTPTTGRHVLQVRATDGNGTPQESRDHEPYPDGATGYHTIGVDVRG